MSMNRGTLIGIRGIKEKDNKSTCTFSSENGR